MHTPDHPDPEAIAEARRVLHALVDQLPADLRLLEATAALLRYRPAQPQPPQPPGGQPEAGA
jgi:hypothetical protein